MKRASYRNGIDFIAFNDDPGDLEPEHLIGTAPVFLLAELFGVDQDRVARDVIRVSARHGGEMRKTQRGFSVYCEFTDSYGAKVRVQASSSAEGRYCWVFTSGGGTLSARQKALSEESPMRPGSEVVNDSTAPHLTPAQARRLAGALLRFAEGGDK